MSKTTGFLFKLARLSADMDAFGSGSPSKMAKRLKNKGLGRVVVSQVYGWPKAKKRRR